MAIHESRKKIEKLLELKEYDTIHTILDEELATKPIFSNEHEERLQDQSKGIIFYLKGLTYLNEKKFDFSIKFALLSLQIREKFNLKADSIDSLFLLGEIYFQKFCTQKWSFPEELEQDLSIKDQFDAINKIYYEEKKDFGLADQSVSYFTKCLELQEGFSSDLEISQTLEKLQFVYQVAKDFENSLKISYRLLALYSELGSEEQKADALRYVGWTTWGNLADTRNSNLSFDNSLKYLNEAIAIYEKLNKEETLAKIYSNLFFIYRYGIGDSEIAFKTLEKGLTLFKKLNDDYGQVWVLYLLASFYYQDLNLEKSLTYLDTCLTIISSSENEKFSDTPIIGLIHSILGNIYLLMGNFEQAMDDFNISLEYVVHNRSFPIHAHLANAILGIAKIYFFHSDFESALKWTKKAIYFGKKNAINLFNVNLILSMVIDVALETQFDDQAKLFLEHIEENKSRITFYSESFHQQAIFNLIKAKILMLSNRLKDKVEADLILQEIIKRCNYNNLKVEAMLLVSKMRLFEYQTTGDTEVLKEFIDQIEKLLTFSKTNNLPNFTIEILKLKSQFQLVEGNLEESRNLLHEALIIAKLSNLNLLQSSLSKDLEKLDEEFQKWTFLIDKNRIFQKRLEHSQLEDYINKALKITKLYE